MNISWNSKLFFCLGIFFLLSCSNVRFTVFDKTMSKKKIDLSQPDQAVILINNSYCAPCLPVLRDSLNAIYKNCILVCLVDKSTSAMSFKSREISNDNLSFDNVYFQFHRKNDPFQYRISNRLYRKYDTHKSPYALIKVNDSIVKVF